MQPVHIVPISLQQMLALANVHKKWYSLYGVCGFASPQGALGWSSRAVERCSCNLTRPVCLLLSGVLMWCRSPRL